MPTESQTQIIRLAFELSQAKLAAQASAALGADARAMSFCGACLTAAALLTGLANQSQLPGAMYIAAFIVIVAAGVSGYSARPVDFFFPGNNYENLKADIEGTGTVEEVLDVLGGFSDKHIARNASILVENNANFLESVRLAVVGLAVALLPQFLALSGY